MPSEPIMRPGHRPARPERDPKLVALVCLLIVTVVAHVSLLVWVLL